MPLLTPRWAAACAILGLSAITACAPGTYEGAGARSGEGGQGGDEGPGTGVADAAPGPRADAEPTVACVDEVAAVPSGEHHSGDACQRCHGGGGAPRFTLGGTLFDALAGGAPVVGATILVEDADGKRLELPSARNGNFWTEEPLRFPIQVSASRCPTTLPMVTAVAAPGDCNAGGCHDSDYRVFLR